MNGCQNSGAFSGTGGAGIFLGGGAGGAERFPVGMGYVPMQPWETPYPPNTALSRGTIFPALDKPFLRGGCRGWQG